MDIPFWPSSYTGENLLEYPVVRVAGNLGPNMVWHSVHMITFRSNIATYQIDYEYFHNAKHGK